MHLFFFFFGLSYLLSYYNAPLPIDVPYFTLLLAFFGETLLFYFHLHGRSHLDIHVHTLLIIASTLTTLSVCFEWKYKQSVMAALGRPFWCFVQGTWLCQIAFVLNPLPNATKWGDNHDQLMLLTSMFCWHIVAALIWFTFLCFRYNR
ncbi:transmembrane protein 45B-like protein, partial [Leptotrombidium deliense]